MLRMCRGYLRMKCVMRIGGQTRKKKERKEHLLLSTSFAFELREKMKTIYDDFTICGSWNLENEKRDDFTIEMESACNMFMSYSETI